MKTIISLIVLSLCTMSITTCMEHRHKTLKEELLAEIKSDNPSLQRITDLINRQALTQGGTDESPLLVAAEKGYFEICRLLIGSGADVNERDSEGHSAFYYLYTQFNHDYNESAYAAQALILHGYSVQPEDVIEASYGNANRFGAPSLIIQAFKKRIAQGELPFSSEHFQRAFEASISPDTEHDDEEDPQIPDLLLDSGAEVLDYAQDPLSFEFCSNVNEIISGNACGAYFHPRYMQKVLARSLGRPQLTGTIQQARETIVATLILMKRKGVSKDVAWYILHLAQEDLINFFAPLIMNRQCKKIPEVFIPLLHRVFYKATINELKRVIKEILNSDLEEYVSDEIQKKFAPEVLEETIGKTLSENILKRLKAPALRMVEYTLR